MKASTVLKSLATFAVLLLCVVALAGNREGKRITVDGAGQTIDSGLSAANLADTVTTDAMFTNNPHKTQIALALTITSGTSTDVTATCEWSPDGSNWFQHADCAYDSAGNYDCVQMSWSFAMSTTTSYKFTLLVPAFGIATRCTFDDAANGTGKISVTGYTTEF